MITNQTIDGVPRELLVRIEYLMRGAGGDHMCITELRALLDANPEENGPCTECGGSLYTWGCSCTPRWPMYKKSALLDAPAKNMIDVSATDWAAIQEAASQSTWMPPEYMRNDWVDDVCRFLREGPAAQPQDDGTLTDEGTMPTPQSQGVPVAYVDYSASGGVRWRPWEHGNLSDGAPLYAEQPAPVAVASLEIVGRQCFPSETMKKMHDYRTEPWVDGNIHESPSTPGLYTVEPLVRLSDVDRLNSKP